MSDMFRDANNVTNAFFRVRKKNRFNGFKLDLLPKVVAEKNANVNPDTKKGGKGNTLDVMAPSMYPPHDICSILSQKKGPKHDVKVASIMYSVSASKIHSKHSLMDWGASGGITGNDVTAKSWTERAGKSDWIPRDSDPGNHCSN